MALFKQKPVCDMTRLPVHIGIILDGNGRWARKRGLPRTAGHGYGAETFRTIATFCRDIGIKYLTVYAFSTENWKRPPEEISAIWDLLRKYLLESIEKMERDRVRIHVMGEPEGMPEDVRRLIDQTKELSTHFEGIQLNICINYGGRAEIVHAVRRLAEECMEGSLSPDEINSELLGNRLYSAGIPDPDLIIRPSGEMRLSNFLLWQSAYSELYFTDTLWPDFTTDEMLRAISVFQRRDRRYGGVKA